MSKLLGRPPERKFLPFKEKVDSLNPAKKVVRAAPKPVVKTQNINNVPQNNTQQNNIQQTQNNQTQNNQTQKSTSTFNLIPWGTSQAKKLLGRNSTELAQNLKNAKIFQQFNIEDNHWWPIENGETVKDANKTFNAVKRKLTKNMATFTDFNLDESLWNMKVYAALFPTNKDALDLINQHKLSWYLDAIKKKLSKAIRNKKGTIESLEEKDPDILNVMKLTMDELKDLENVKKKIPFLTDILSEDTVSYINGVIEKQKQMPYENAETVLEKSGIPEKKEIKEKRFRLFGNKTADEIVGTTVEEFTQRMNKAKIYRKYNLDTKQWDVDPFLEIKVNRKNQYYNLKKKIKENLTTFTKIDGLFPPDWDEKVFCALFPETPYAIERLNEKKLDALRDFLLKMRFQFKPDLKKEFYEQSRNSSVGREIFQMTYEQLKDPDVLERRFSFLKGNKDEYKNAFAKIQLDDVNKQSDKQGDKQSDKVGGGGRGGETIKRGRTIKRRRKCRSRRRKRKSFEK